MVIDGCIGSNDLLSSVIFSRVSACSCWFKVILAGQIIVSHSISFFVPVAHCYLCGWLMVAWYASVPVESPLVEKEPVPGCCCYGH